MIWKEVTGKKSFIQESEMPCLTSSVCLTSYIAVLSTVYGAYAAAATAAAAGITLGSGWFFIFAAPNFLFIESWSQ